MATVTEVLQQLSHRGTAYVQAILSFLFIGAYFFIMVMFLLGKVHVPDNMKDAFITLLGVLTGGVGLILAFWFQRQRTSQDAQEPGQ